MKIFVINLDSREDRLQSITKVLDGYEWERFPAINGHIVDDFEQLGFTPCSRWRDPLLKRPLTQTEIACSVSHFKLWEKCIELDEPILILEDDAYLVDKLDLSFIESLLDGYDMLYLDHREMSPEQVINLNSFIVKPYYPYLNHAYVITPELAKRLVRCGFDKNIIPVDEFFPCIQGVDYHKHGISDVSRELLDELQRTFAAAIPVKAAALKQSIFKQHSRSLFGSDIETGKIMEYQSKLHVITVGTDVSKTEILQKSAEKNGFSFENIAAYRQWDGGDMSGAGGGQKLNHVREKLIHYHPDDYVFFADGYDVLVNDSINEIIKRFLGFNCDILFAAEPNCWPDATLADQFPISETRYRYLNSGLYIAKVGALRKLLNEPIRNTDDDQLYLSIKYLKNLETQELNIKLDHENYIFQCIGNALPGEIVIKENNQFLNNATRCCPCVIHGNGGPAIKQKLKEYYDQIYIKGQGFFITQSNIKDEGQEFLTMPFMTPEMCQWLVNEAETKGKWESMYGDKFPGQEVRIRSFSMEFWNALEEHFKRTINPQLEKHWWPLLMYGLRDAFVIKYSPGTQDRLSCHHDASLVSGIVRLNDEYEGGETFFYRQNYSNINIPKGTLLMWPGQVTHGHEGKPVTKGTKYSLVIWTARKPGDINY